MNFRLRLDIHWSSVRSSSSPPGELPAQVTRMSIFPSRASVASTQRRTPAMTLMSPAMGTMVLPVAAVICFAVVSSGSAVRAVMTTSAPSRARSSATARPMPLLAPVTKATLPPSSRSNAYRSRWPTGSWRHQQPDRRQRSMTGTLTSGPAESGSDGWYIKYQEPNRVRFGWLGGIVLTPARWLGRNPADSRPGGWGGIRPAPAGWLTVGASGARRARGAWCRGGRWPRYARVRPADAAAEGRTLLTAGAGHATPASAPRMPLRKADRW